MHHLPLLVADGAGNGFGIDIDIYAGLVGIAQYGEIATRGLVARLP